MAPTKLFRGKKGDEVPETVFWFGFVYSIMTVGVVMSLVIFPKALIEQSIQPVAMDQSIQAQQLSSRLWQTNPYTGRTTPFEYSDNLKLVENTITQKKMAYSVELGKDKVIYEKQLYDIARPISPHRYSGYTEVEAVNANKGKQNLKIEEYYPHKYEVKPA